MKLVNLNREEYQNFYNNYQDASFMQSIELSNLKKEYGNIIHFVGIKENNMVLAASMILEYKSHFGKKIFYAPRGLMLDYHNKELLSFFTKELKKYIKKHGGFILTIDPAIIYRIRNSDGDIIQENGSDDETINNLLDLGYKHHGFNLYLDANQARWCYRMALDEDYELKKSKFSKSTRKNIESCIKKGLMVREGTIEDLDTMTEIFDLTSKRKDFFSRSLSYYQKMYKNMHDLMTIYIAYLDPDTYLSHSINLLEEEKKNNEIIQDKMKKDLVGNKLKNQLETSNKLIEKYTNEVERAKKFKEDNPNGKDIGCLLSIRSGIEYLTLSSGVLEEYKSFTPKYLMYEHHIKEAYKEGFKYCNFYGITGDFNKDGKYYGIYEFKKGFNGNVIEYVGEFDLKVSWFYNVYRVLKKIKGMFNK